MSRGYLIIFLILILLTFVMGLTINAQQTPVVVTPVVIQPLVSLNSSSSSVTVNPVYQQPSVISTPTNSGPRLVDANSNWYRFESIELEQAQGLWQLFHQSDASDGGFHRSFDLGAIMRLNITAAGVRLGYRTMANGGDLHIVVDGLSQSIIPTLLVSGDERTFLSDPIYFPNGTHIVDIVTNGLQGQVFEIDFLDIYVGPEVNPTIVPLITETIDANARVSLLSFDLVTAPQVVSTVAVPQDVIVLLDIVAFYDKNTNGVADANEGISNLSVRVLDQISNRVMASSLTDLSGFARIQIISSRDLLLVVPLLGQSEAIVVSRGSRNGNTINHQWLIQVEPINIPALIP